MSRPASSLSAPPTAREIVLLLVLLTFLLVITSNFASSLESNQPSYPFLQPPSNTDNNSTFANNITESNRLETVLSWKEWEKVPDTVVVAHVPGWTIFDRLYVLNSTFYVVTDHPASIPDRKFMISTAVRILTGPIEAAKRIATDKELQVISTADAKTLFGSGADVLDGVTVRLVILPPNPIPPLTNYESGLPMTRANCEVHLHTPRKHAADPIDLALPTITIGPLSSSSDSGARIPRLTLPSRKTETRLCPHRAECYSHTSTTTTGEITLK